MEGGNVWLEYATYAIVGVVLCALGLLFLRTLWFFLSLLLIPMTEAASRVAPFAGLARRWGERGARRDPTSWRHALPETEGAVRSVKLPPSPVRRGLALGAALGALPGLVLAIRGALAARAGGGSAGEIAAAAGIGIGLVAAAGALVGAGVGAGAGAAWDALYGER